VESDESLMCRLQAGDESALTELFQRYRSRLYGFLVRRVGDAADDVFQDTWMRVARAADRFDPRRRFSTWLFQIANNLCRDLGRRRAVRNKARQELLEQGRTPPRDAMPRPDLRIEVTERIGLLPDRLQEVVLLRYYQQMTEREIADVVGIPTGTVKSRLHAAIRALRAQETPPDAD
jgi:RNA polymerase sigma-70 factor (ECF subfamily)